MAVLFSGNSHFFTVFPHCTTRKKVVKAGELLRMNKVIRSINVCSKCATKVKTTNKVVCRQPLNLISISLFFNTEYLHHPRSRTIR